MFLDSSRTLPDIKEGLGNPDMSQESCGRFPSGFQLPTLRITLSIKLGTAQLWPRPLTQNRQTYAIRVQAPICKTHTQFAIRNALSPRLYLIGKSALSIGYYWLATRTWPLIDEFSKSNSRNTSKCGMGAVYLSNASPSATYDWGGTQ
jgi:hypothetical protein